MTKKLNVLETAAIQVIISQNAIAASSHSFSSLSFHCRLFPLIQLHICNTVSVIVAALPLQQLNDMVVLSQPRLFAKTS